MQEQQKQERSLVTLSRAESVDLLSRAQVGRVVFTERALPAVVPVTFALYADFIVMRTSERTSLAAAALRGGVLAFEVDDFDATSRSGASVVVLGLPELVTHAAERARINLVLEPWAPGHHDVWIRLPLTMVTGRRVLAQRTAQASSAVL